MSKTIDFFNATRGLPINTVPGRLAIAQAVELFDGLTGIVVVCSRAYMERFDSVPEWMKKRIDKINSSLSLSKTLQIFKVWAKWTHQFHGDQFPDLSAVESFLRDEKFLKIIGVNRN